MNDSIKTELDNFMRESYSATPARWNFTRRRAKSANRSCPSF